MRLTAAAGVIAMVAIAVAVPGSATPLSVAEDLTSLVNPLSGTLGAGFPTVGAGVPFGSATPGPATVLPTGEDPVNYVGYAYQDSHIRGFALTHYDGAGVHIGGELPMMPTTGAVTTNDPTKLSSPFTHLSEVAQPGYYSVDLLRYQTKVELTATPRTAIERLTFPKSSQANLLFDVSRHNDGLVPSSLRIVDPHTVTGNVYLPDSKGFKIWFTARFDRPMSSFGTWSGSVLKPGTKYVTGQGSGGWVTFDTTKNQVVGVRVGLSYVDSRGSAANLASEAPERASFASLRERARALWNARLHSIDVTGGYDDQRRTFYTNLYRAFLMPTTADDANGRYLGFDGATHKVLTGHHHYADFSLWDTYRAQTPLLSLAAKDVAHDVAISILDAADQSKGQLPRWTHGNRDYGIMGGDSATPTLASFVSNGAITGAEAQRAYAAILRQGTIEPPAEPRNRLPMYLKHGFIPVEDSDIGAALTLEYAADDAAVAWVAKAHGTKAQAAEFTRRAGFWRNLMSPDDHFLRPRMRNGAWATPTDLGVTKTWNPSFPDGWQEGTGWQYLWAVPQDVPDLAKAMGGQQVAVDRLDSFFSTTLQSQVAPIIPIEQTQTSFFGIAYYGNQFTPANETDLQSPWLYNWLGAPWKAQTVLHAASRVWSDKVNGLPGNDDAGTMSAWYVLTAIGLYQPQAGAPAWVLSSPLFDSVRINGPAQGGAPLLTIEAPRASVLEEYVASATLDRRSLTRNWLAPAEVAEGRTLRLSMTSATGSTWASRAQDAPPSL